MKHIKYIALFLVIFFLFIFANAREGISQGGLWWQREIPSPSANQIINPRYLEKRRELEIAWDQYNSDINARNHFRRLGQKTNALNAAISNSRNNVRRLEHELSQIPMYISR